MDASKSKFDYESFNGGYHVFAVNAGKYTEQQAIEIYKDEYSWSDNPYIIEKSHVKWRAGINEDNEPVVGWWFDYNPTEKRSVEVWAFRQEYKSKVSKRLTAHQPINKKENDKQ
jgi:hypothetical protein